MVLREIDAGGTAFRAAIEAGDEELEHEVLTAAETVSAEFGEMEFLLADLARAAGEIQDSLGGQGAELRAAIEQVGAAVRRRAGHPRGTGGHGAAHAAVDCPAPGGRGRGPRWTGGCPYRGLLPYGQAHEAVFFGREQLTAALAGSLVQSGLVMLTGASGAGKTSLLQAGLVPALARGVQVPGSASWPRISMTPGTGPLTELAAQLARLGGRDPAVIRDGLADAPGDAHLLLSEIAQAAGASRLVLIIDQFEQVFAAGDDEAGLERAAFVEAVRAAATRPAGPRAEPPLLAVIAVRGDYWDRCAAYPQLVPFMERDQIVVGPMTEAELRRVITGPAEASGLAVEPGLADAILADLRSAGEQTPGRAVLPLLSQAMTATWEHRQGDELTRQAYLDAGDGAGIARAVEVSAETAYGGLTEDQQAIAREVFRRLTGTGPDRRPARRAVSISDLRAGRAAAQWPQISAVLEAFARHRLVVLDAGRAEIAHDVLLQAWPRLRGWLAEDETSMILYGQLAEDTARWRASGGDRALLYRDVQLAAAGQAARVWAGDPGRYPPLGTGEAEFLRASGRAAARGRRRRQALAGLVTVVVVAVLAGAGVAVKDARTTAARQSTANTAQHLAAQSTDLDADRPGHRRPPGRGRLAAGPDGAGPLQPAPVAGAAGPRHLDRAVRRGDRAGLQPGRRHAGGRVLQRHDPAVGSGLAPHDPRHHLRRRPARPGLRRRREAARGRGRRRRRHVEPGRRDRDQHARPLSSPAQGSAVVFSPDGAIAGHRRRRRERPAVERGHRAGDRGADEL